jgi:hypothetical protein
MTRKATEGNGGQRRAPAFRCLLLLPVALGGIPSPLSADSFSAVGTITSAASLKPFARDLGGLMGSNSFHTARPLGFSGFELSADDAVQFAPDKNDTILRAGGAKPIWMPMVQADIGMPYRFDGFVRGTSYQGFTMAGGGLRYGLLKTNDKSWAPQLLAVLEGDVAADPYFSATHYGGGIAASIGNRFIAPYLGAGFDATQVTVGSDSTLNGTSVSVLEPRFTAGTQIALRAFVYAHLSYVYMHRQNGAQGGLGVRF